MGATEFAIDNFGPTLGDAYNKQVGSDHYDYGHSGYTGTTAEKDGVIEIDRPPRITAGRVMDTVRDASQWYFWLETDEKYQHLHVRPKVRCRDAYYRLREWYPTAHAHDIIKTHDDKWGPALAVEQSPAEKKKRWNGLPRGSKTFLFFGMASC